MKLLARAHTKRAAAYSWCSNFEAAMDSFDKVLSSEEFAKIIGDENIANLHKDKARVQQRMKSNAIKQDGDRLFYRENVNEALAKYREALEVDQENEYALANISAIHHKRLEYEESREVAS